MTGLSYNTVNNTIICEYILLLKKFLKECEEEKTPFLNIGIPSNTKYEE